MPLITSSLQPNANAQCVSFKDVFSSAHLRLELCEQGHHTTVLVLELMGLADMAWDMSVLTHKERLGRLLCFKHLLLTVLAPAVASLAQMGKGRVLGVPRDLLWAKLHNADSYLLFIQHFPLLAEHQVARFWSQDDVEGVFAWLCFLCRFRPGVEVGLARLVRSEVLATQRCPSTSPSPPSAALGTCQQFRQLQLPDSMMAASSSHQHN